MKNNKLKISLWIIISLVLEFIVGISLNTKVYNTLIKPPLSPPAIVFPIVWAILYILMAISLIIVLNKEYNIKSIFLYFTQLVVNLIWPIIFFNFKLYYLSAIWIVLLIYLVILMIVNFYNIKKIAAYLQFPYFIWLIFALYLNIGVALFN